MLIFICCALILFLHMQKQKSIFITKVILSDDSLTMSTGDTHHLTATVLYSDDSTNNRVLWNSSNSTVAAIDQNGLITALANGNTTIIAQASKNNASELAECTITVKSPPSGYSISANQIGKGSHAYVYVMPYDDNITNIIIYGKAPSGILYTPDIDENNFYSFNECGIWTIYASIENDAGIYEAHKPEDFITIEVTKVVNILDDSFKMYDNIIQQLVP